MAATEYATYYINLKEGANSGKTGGSKQSQIKFAWRAPTSAYPDAVAKLLGVTKATEKETGLIYGMNNPRPVKVRINIKTKQGSSKSVLLFCDPSQIANVLIKGTLRGISFKSGTITTISTPGSSTNPNRRSSGNGSSTKKPGIKKPGIKRPKRR